MVPVVQTCGEMLLVNINIIKYICKECVDLKILEERKIIVFQFPWKILLEYQKDLSKMKNLKHSLNNQKILEERGIPHLQYEVQTS